MKGEGYFTLYNWRMESISQFYQKFASFWKHFFLKLWRKRVKYSPSPNGGFKCVRTSKVGPSLIALQWKLTRLSWVKIDFYLSIDLKWQMKITNILFTFSNRACCFSSSFWIACCIDAACSESSFSTFKILFSRLYNLSSHSFKRLFSIYKKLNNSLIIFSFQNAYNHFKDKETVRNLTCSLVLISHNSWWTFCMCFCSSFRYWCSLKRR